VEKQSTQKKILVVDDDPEILTLANLMLGLDGYDVQLLPDARSIANKQAAVPDLYIIDKRLPYVSGTEICRLIKSRENTRRVPVVIISAFQCEAEALSAGADMYIEKPFIMHDFLTRIAYALSGQSPA
jgi:two-component system phosphate regulon response regulator PhoB